jgi:hypothetical protein
MTVVMGAQGYLVDLATLLSLASAGAVRSARDLAGLFGGYG